MKKVTAIFLTFLMVVTLAACTKNSEPSNTDASNTQVNASVETAITDEATKKQDNTAVPTETIGSDKSAKETAEPENDDNVSETDNDTDEAKVLVAYFSATNTTKGVAENLAGGLVADIYEIMPETPYTDADLNYHDDNSRTTIEMNDPNVRPAISGSVENMDQYDVIFLGYPIWWGQAPKIICTFMESYDFSGKTIVPFCTSGSSGIGSSATNLHPLANGAVWLSGKRFSGSASQSDIMAWVKSLELNLDE